MSNTEREATQDSVHGFPNTGGLCPCFRHYRRVNSQIERGYAGNTVANHVRLLRTICRDAQAKLDLPRDPVARVETPKGHDYSEDDERNILSADKLGGLLSVFEKQLSDWHPFAFTLAYTGLRWGEAVALRWNDLDERQGLVRIRRSVWHGVVTDTKTHKRRSVALTPELAEVLRDHRRQLIATQHPGLEEGWIFPSDAGQPHHHGAMNKALKRALRLAGINKHFIPHGFRRTFNNLCRGVASEIVVRSMVGHSTHEMHELYSEVSANEKRAAVSNMMTLVKDASRQK